MTTTMRPTHPSSLSTYRQHPYHTPSSSSSSSSAQPRSIPPTSGPGPKWQVHPVNTNPNTNTTLPPSPPRSNREHSDTPSSIGLGVAFGGSTGGKWWDEELPAPPASLSSILESFRKSGEGDRDLLLSILGAKKAEEERLTALIQTRLTVLQARLSLHSAAASLGKSPANPPAYLPTPDQSTTMLSPPSATSERAHSPSFTLPPRQTNQNQSQSQTQRPLIHLPPMQFTSAGSQFPPIRNVEAYAVRAQEKVGKKGCCPRDREEGAGAGASARGSTSPKSVASEGGSERSSRNGLEMLLDAGMETERRASGDRERE